MSATEPPEATRDRRWTILVILSIAQLMVVLDTTVVNIALPSAQLALHFSDAGRQWIVTGYALAFGSLLLVGGRISDLFGRKPRFSPEASALRWRPQLGEQRRHSPCSPAHG